MESKPRTMPALSLTQPWAILVSCGAKLVETRSWSTRYRGQLAIHAAKGFPAYARLLSMEAHFWLPLTDAGHSLVQIHRSDRLIHDLPLGAVVAVAQLVDCVSTETLARTLSGRELAFGDYTKGRHAWVLADVVALRLPVQTRGALGLWKLDEDTYAKVREELSCCMPPS